MRWTMLLVGLIGCGGAAEPAHDEKPAEAPAAEAPAAPVAEAPAAPAAAAKRVDLNAASREELLTVPGVNEKLAKEFEEYRPYLSIQQFRKDIGKYVSAEQVAAYEPHVYVPIDFNASDAETLRQMPGLDAAEAEKLVAGRPYADRAAFEAAVGAMVTPEELPQGLALLKPQ